MTRTLGWVTLLVRDYDEAISFFVHTLGFRLMEDTPLDGGKRWVVLQPGDGGAGLLLARAADAEQTAQIGRQAGGRVAFFLHTGDFRRDHDAFRARGVRFEGEPREEAYGTVAVFADLYGNRWDLLQLHDGAQPGTTVHPLKTIQDDTMSIDRYSNPLTERYASAEMSYIFSPKFKFGTWRRLWLALAETEQELGLPIPDAALAALRDHLDDFDLKRAGELERQLRHDVMAHVHHLGEQAPEARAIIHLGATSAYVGDNTDLIQHREALRLVAKRIVAVVAGLSAFARQHRDLATLGFTHFQPAQPTTVGKRATLWIQDLLLDLEEVEFRIGTLRFHGSRGTTGTQASFVDLFQGDGEKAERLTRRIAEKMGFAQAYGVGGQTYPRKVDSACLSTLSGVAQSASKFANDVRLLSHLKEVEEPFEEQQIGSSAMPYKRNPMRSERINALARHAITLTIDPAFTAASQWFERTLDDSANKRIAIPEAYLSVDAVMLLMHNVSSGMVVYPEMIRRRLMEELPFMATENLMMRAARGGGDRQDLHEKVRVHSIQAGLQVKQHGRPNDLMDRIAADPAFGVTRAELEEDLRPELYVGRAPQQVDEFLAEWVEPVLARYPDAVGESAPELKV